MTGADKKLIAAMEGYFADFRRVRASGGGDPRAVLLRATA